MVPRLQIDLTAPGTNHLTLAQFGLKMLCTASLGLIISFLWVGTTLHGKIDELENHTATIHQSNTQLVSDAKSTGLDLTHQAIRKIPQQVTFIKHVRERVGFSWTQLLTDLESAVPRHARLDSVSLDEKKDRVILHGSTRSLQDLNRFIHQLEKHPSFQDVILAQHATKKKKKLSGNPSTSFSMNVTYTQEARGKTDPSLPKKS